MGKISEKAISGKKESKIQKVTKGSEIIRKKTLKSKNLTQDDDISLKKSKQTQANEREKHTNEINYDNEKEESKIKLDTKRSPGLDKKITDFINRRKARLRGSIAKLDTSKISKTDTNVAKENDVNDNQKDEAMAKKQSKNMTKAKETQTSEHGNASQSNQSTLRPNNLTNKNGDTIFDGNKRQSGRGETRIVNKNEDLTNKGKIRQQRSWSKTKDQEKSSNPDQGNIETKESKRAGYEFDVTKLKEPKDKKVVNNENKP